MRKRKPKEVDVSDAPQPRPARRSRDDIVRAAMRILDEGSLADLSMRNIAAKLGLQVSALYWHFPNKQTLLAAVADQIVARAFVEPEAQTEDWASALRIEARRLREALLSVADGAEIVASTIALGLGERPVAGRLIAALDSAPFDDDTKRDAATALLQFIIGNASLEQQRRQAEALGVISPRDAGSVQPRDSVNDAAFELGLRMLVAGLAHTFSSATES